MEQEAEEAIGEEHRARLQVAILAVGEEVVAT